MTDQCGHTQGSMSEILQILLFCFLSFHLGGPGIAISLHLNGRNRSVPLHPWVRNSACCSPILKCSVQYLYSCSQVLQVRGAAIVARDLGLTVSVEDLVLSEYS